MRVRAHHNIDDLANDAVSIAKKAQGDMRKCVKTGLRTGNSVARDFARLSAGKHGKHYPRSFTAEMHNAGGLVGNVISGEYGPDVSRRQGGMSFEGGSRNQRPHLDLARSADIIAPAFVGEVRRLPAGWFWN